MNIILQKKNWFRRTIVCLWSYLCVLSIGKVVSLHGAPEIYWGGRYFGYNIESLLIFGVTIWLLNRFIQAEDKRMKVIAMSGGILMAMAIVYGAYAHYKNDIFGDIWQNLQQLGMVFSILSLTMSVFREILVWLGVAERWISNRSDYKEIEGKHPVRFFLLMWSSIFATYIPLFLAVWPGNFVFDAQYQMQNVVEGYYSTHHPLIHTLMMGYAYLFGRSLGDVSFGYQFYTIAQMLILTSSFAFVLLYFYKKRVRTAFLVITWCFFALFPMHSLFSVSSTKDVLCAAFFLYFIVFLVRLIVDKEKMSPISYVGMICSGVLVSLFRDNVSYAILATAILLVAFAKGWKEKGKIVLLILTVLLLANLTNKGLIECTNAKLKDTYQESMSVPLQCMARVASYRRGELDQALYDEICRYIPEENIPLYNPYNSDPIKNEANEDLMKSNFINFLKLWAKVGLKFPDEYVESVVTNTMGYWYPLHQGIYVSNDIGLYHTWIACCEEQIEKRCYCKWAEQIYNGLFGTLNYRYVPILGYLFRNALYVWFIIVYFLWCIYKKEKDKLLLGVLPLVYLATCMLGPMPALRYIYSLIVCVPILAYTATREKQ